MITFIRGIKTGDLIEVDGIQQTPSDTLPPPPSGVFHELVGDRRFAQVFIKRGVLYSFDVGTRTLTDRIFINPRTEE